jgi:hypothetical protein
MRLIRIAAPAAAAALAAGGIAVAAGGGNSAKTEQVTATFTAAPTAKTKTRTCTGADGTYNQTKGVYTGTSTGDPRLSGDIVIRTKTLVNLDTGLGVTTGKVSVKKDGKAIAKAGLKAVNTQRGKLDGFLTGHARNGQGNARLFANFSAAFNSDGSQLTGELGADAPVAPQNTAVLQSGHCGKAKPPKPGKGPKH